MNESIITLIHKKGNKHDPYNYRGISLTSNLGKSFNRVIYNRLLKFANENDLIFENQIGFKEQACTSDHIFTLTSTIDNAKANKRKVFAPFYRPEKSI